MSLFKALLITIVFIAFTPSLFAETLDELVANADAAQQQREFGTALIHLKNATKLDPDSIPIRLKMVELYVQTGQGVQADVELDKLKRLGAKPSDTAVLAAKSRLLQGEFEQLTGNLDLLDLPQSEIARLRAIQGQAYFEQRKFPQARQMFQRAILLSPSEPEVELGQARLFELDGEQQKQQQLILSLLDRYKGNADVLIMAGNYYRSQQQFDRALELFAEAGEIQPSNVNVWYGVVRSHIGKKSYNDAKMEISKVLQSYPEHQVGNYLLALIAFEEGDYNRAKSAIDIVLKGEKRKFEALKLLSIIQFQQKDYSEAEKNIDKFLTFNPGDVQGLKTLAAIYLKRKQGFQALKILNQLEQLDDAYIYSMIATAYLQLGNREKSDFYMNKSLQTAPDDFVIQKHFQRSKLQAGESLELEFSDTDFNDFLSEGHVPILNLLRQKKYNEAIRIIQGYMKTMPDNALLHYLLGSTYLYKGEIEKARDQLQQSLKLNPRLVESRIYLAKLFLLNGKERDAEREYREVLRTQKNNDQAMIALAGIAQRAGKEEEMLQWLNRSRGMNSSSLASREVLEKYYRGRGDLDRALSISKEMVGIQPQNVSLLLRLAKNQKATGRVDLAIQTFRKIVKLKPEHPSSWFGLGRLQFVYNSLDSAKDSFEKVLQLEPENLTAKVILIQIDLNTNQLDQALVKARKLQQQHPNSPAGYDLLGDIYIALNKPAKAIAQYEQSVKLKYSSEAYIKLHSAYNRNNQIKKGFELLKQWTEKTPQDFVLKEVLAITYQRRGEFEKARILYEEIIQKTRNNDRVLNNLALVSLELNSPMSIEYAEMAFNLNPDNDKNKDTLGWVLLKNHHLEKSLALLKEASEDSPGDADIRYHYAVALLEQGDKNQASNQLYLALGMNGTFYNRSAAEKLLAQLKANSAKN